MYHLWFVVITQSYVCGVRWNI